MPADAMSDAALDPDAPGDAALGLPIDQVFAKIRAGEPLPGICFAVSRNRHRAACATGGWVVAESVGLGIEIVGDRGDLVSAWDYYADNKGSSGEVWFAPSNPEALDEARTALQERGYVPNTLPEIAVDEHQTVTVGAWTIRRNRAVLVEGRAYDPKLDLDITGEPAPQGGVQTQYADGMLVKCGREWLSLPLDPGHIHDTEGVHTVSLLTDDRLLVVERTHYGTEGDYGGERRATVVKLRELCSHP
jgi:hypothetical protein